MAGSGSYVSNTEGHVTYGGAGNVGGENLLLEKFNQTFNLAEEMKAEVEGYLTELNDSLVGVTTSDEIDALYGTVTIDDVAALDLIDWPTVGTLSLPNFANVNFPLKPFLKAAPDIDLNYTAPVKPTEVNPSINFTVAPYNSDVWLALFTSVYDGMVNGGTGLGASTEEALYARQQERNRLANEKAYRTALNAGSAQGFDFPTDVTIAIEQEMGAEILRQSINASNEIAISEAQLAQTNTHFMLDKGAALEQILRDFYNKKEDRSLDADKAAADLILRNYSEKVRMYLAEWDGVKADLQAKINAIQIIVAENQILIDGYKAEITGAIGQTEQIANERNSLVEAYKGEVQAYAAKTSAIESWYRTLTEHQKAQLQKAELELRKITDQLRLKLDDMISINTLKEKIAEALASISAQVLASSLTAVNTTIGHSSRTSEAISENFSHSDGITEQHYFDETET
jgi:hypothetical protein